MISGKKWPSEWCLEAGCGNMTLDCSFFFRNMIVYQPSHIPKSQPGENVADKAHKNDHKKVLAHDNQISGTDAHTTRCTVGNDGHHLLKTFEFWFHTGDRSTKMVKCAASKRNLPGMQKGGVSTRTRRGYVVREEGYFCRNSALRISDEGH